MTSQTKVITDLFSPEVLQYLLELPETLSAKQKVEKESSGQITFIIHLTKELQDWIYSTLGLKLESVPLRWIKGDTKPHLDTAAGSSFEKTYLAYLTDSPGSFVIDKETYVIRQGTAFVFDEGLWHETIHTGTEPRLLLGPMSEMGMAVGSGGTNISGPSGTSAYLKQESGTVSYSYDLNTWTPVSLWPIFVSNSDLTPTSTFNLKFTTDITVNGTAEHLIISSNYVQIGDRQLNANGSTPIITVDNVIGYPGLVQNNFAYSFVYVFNLTVLSTNGSTLEPGYGWIAGISYASNGATSNYIVNCHSDGDIANSSGGIVGQNTGDSGGTLYVVGCSSTGAISGVTAGGIVGQLSGSNAGNVFVYGCWSEGSISANTSDGCGGIVGSLSVNVNVSYSYSTGVISGPGCGGILGANCGLNLCEVSGCYSTGDIVSTASNGGGICGSLSPGAGETYTINISNCYTSGNLESPSPNATGAISGRLFPGTGTIALSISSCYTIGAVIIPSGYFIGGLSAISGSGTGYSIVNSYSEAGSGGTPGSWSDSHATSVLIGYPSSSPGVGTSWASLSANTPYLLFEMGYTPYSIVNIDMTDLVRTQSFSVTSGQSTQSGIISGLNYFILEKSGGTPSSYGTIGINTVTGSIVTTRFTVADTYTIYVYNTGSYNITTVTLTVTSPPPPPVPSNQWRFEFPGATRAFNQKSRFCGTRAVSTYAVGLGAMRGIGSTKRILNSMK
jgi:hypothetical protein